MPTNPYIDKSEECLQARRLMRKMLLSREDEALTSTYYLALMLSEHEAIRRTYIEIGG